MTLPASRHGGRRIMGEQWTYYGVDIYPSDRNSAGIRWYCHNPDGDPHTPPLLRADTKDGMRSLIREALGK